MGKKLLFVLLVISVLLIQPMQLYAFALKHLIFPTAATEYLLMLILLLLYSALIYGTILTYRAIKKDALTEEENAVSERKTLSNKLLICVALPVGCGIVFFHAYQNKNRLMHVAAECGCEVSFELAVTLGAKELKADALAALIAVPGHVVSAEKHCAFLTKALSHVNIREHQHLLYRYYSLCTRSADKAHLARSFEEYGFKMPAKPLMRMRQISTTK